MFTPRARESFHTVHSRSIAVVLLLALLAVGGFAAVRELTRAAPQKPVPTIVVDPDGSAQRDGAGERHARGDGRPTRAERARERERRRERARKRREARERRGGFDPPPTSLPQPEPPVT